MEYILLLLDNMSETFTGAANIVCLDGGSKLSHIKIGADSKIDFTVSNFQLY